MQLQVTISLSDRLYALLEEKLPNLGRRVKKAVSKEFGAQVREESSIVMSVVEDRPEAEEIEVEVSAPSVPEATAAPASEVVMTSTPEATATPTLEDCRAAVKRARIRFEGEGYENKTGEGYERYHTALSNQIKQIVLTVSGGQAKKIPLLPEDCRAAFIAECDALTIDEKGFIAPPPAPY